MKSVLEYVIVARGTAEDLEAFTVALSTLLRDVARDRPVGIEIDPIETRHRITDDEPAN